MSEIQVVKTEITEALLRRLGGDNRTPAKTYNIATVALAEVVADMTFAAAKDHDHARRLLDIIVARIESRWRELSGV
jgi:hypothetical protein